MSNLFLLQLPKRQTVAVSHGNICQRAELGWLKNELCHEYIFTLTTRKAFSALPFRKYCIAHSTSIQLSSLRTGNHGQSRILQSMTKLAYECRAFGRKDDWPSKVLSG